MGDDGTIAVVLTSCVQLAPPAIPSKPGISLARVIAEDMLSHT